MTHILVYDCRKDDDWKLSRGAYIFIIIGLVLLLGAISAVTATIEPWTVSKNYHGVKKPWMVVFSLAKQGFLYCYR